MDAREKLDRFSKEVIFDAALASEATVSGVDEVESGTVIGLMSCDRLSLIRSKLPKKSCAINKCTSFGKLDFNAQVFLKLISVRLASYQPYWSFL